MPEPRPFDRLGPPSRPAPWGILALLLLTGLALIRNGSGEYDSRPPQPAPAAATGAPSPAALPASPAVRTQVSGVGDAAPVRPTEPHRAARIDPPPARAPHPTG
ncbi:hypothetical protein [Streptomyces sp. BBFR102]|uniref:hypothetical protein n=1 Tax=Streptomyces sp. BBFR102 TaxID=3448171 RepID=UPI003F5356C6